MSILATCSCGGQQRLPNSYEGKQVKCLKCGKMIQVGGGPALTERRMKIENTTLVARCESQQTQQADSVLKKVANQQHVGVGITDKVKIPFGWSELQIRKQASGEMLVCEADYSQNPWADVREDIVVCIKVGWGQLDLIKKFSANPLTCTFSQSIQTAAGCFDEEELLMRRLKKPKGEDSGWFIGPVDQHRLAVIHEKSEYETILSYQLLTLRPSMVYALMLPIEFKIQFRGDTMTSVVDGDDRTIFTA